jgi:threonine dehydratase
MSDVDITLEAIRAARAALVGHVNRTPMLTSTTAARVILDRQGASVADGRVHLKAESLQKTGSFKVRATRTRLAALTSDERARGAITISAGNAAQAYAWAGRDTGVPVTVVMPEGAVRSKVDACLGYGAEVVLYGDHVGATWDHMLEIRDDRDLVFVHPFDQPEVIVGNGSLGLEILDDLPDVDVVVVPIGGGGLISGVAAALKAVRPGVRVVGVEPRGSDALARALAAGQAVRIEPRSIADGLNSPFAGELTLPLVRRYVDDIAIVDDAEILGGLRFAVERCKLVLEPAGAAALAALLFGHVVLREGERVCAVLSGGNVEVGRVGELISAGLPVPGL